MSFNVKKTCKKIWNFFSMLALFQMSSTEDFREHVPYAPLHPLFTSPAPNTPPPPTSLYILAYTLNTKSISPQWLHLPTNNERIVRQIHFQVANSDCLIKFLGGNPLQKTTQLRSMIKWKIYSSRKFLQ